MNLLRETKKIMGLNARPIKDIVFIGTEDGRYGCTWDQFRKLADFNYNPGYGLTEIRDDLVIVFKDGSYLTRAEYDGSEWWELHKTPTVPETYEKFTDLFSDYKRHLMSKKN